MVSQAVSCQAQLRAHPMTSHREAALSELCGPDDVITPYRAESEEDRKGRPPQNFRIEHKLKPQRPLWRKLLGRPERYYHRSVGYYEHMPAWRVRTYVGEEIWESYFKFAFDRNPWDRQVSWYFYKTKSKRWRPNFERFMGNKRRAYVDNYQLYTIDGAPALDFIGRYESLDDDLNKALQLAGISRKIEVPRTNVGRDRDSARDYHAMYNDETQALVAKWYQPEIKLLGYGF